ncbi:MAG TPA: DUF6134 family protein [Gammaproteobacteria bacterium]|nr:DUF6134 family protein [Gammaproteobacteria bacterium]
MRIRPVLAACAAIALLLGASGAGAAPRRDYDFRVLVDGKPIGTQSFHFTEDGAGYEMSTEARIKVRFLFFTAYRFHQTAVERWRGGCLRTIRSRTDDNGNRFRVRGRAVDTGLSLTVNGSEDTLDQACVHTFAYWNPRLLRSQRLLDSETGKLKKVSLARLGRRPLPWDPDTRATSYRLHTGDGPTQLWYNANGRWLGLRSKLKNGHTVVYRPI